MKRNNTPLSHWIGWLLWRFLGGCMVLSTVSLLATLGIYLCLIIGISCGKITPPTRCATGLLLTLIGILVSGKLAASIYIMKLERRLAWLLSIGGGISEESLNLSTRLKRLILYIGLFRIGIFPPLLLIYLFAKEGSQHVLIFIGMVAMYHFFFFMLYAWGARKIKRKLLQLKTKISP